VQVGRKVIEEDAGITGLKSVDLFFFFIFTTAELNLLHGASSLASPLIMAVRIRKKEKKLSFFFR